MFNQNQFNQFNQPFNMNNMNNNFNMNQAMMNMNQLTGMPINMSQSQFINNINSNPMMLMMWNQMLRNMQNQKMFNNQFVQNNNQMMQGNGQNMAFNMNNMNNFNNGQTAPNQINIAFVDNTDRKCVVQTTPNEYMSSVINKYINKSGDNNINLYLYNGKRVVQSLTVAELGLTDGVEIYVSNIGEVRGA